MKAVTPDQIAEFIEAATWHGNLDRADALLATHPELASSCIHIAAILGDDAGVRHFLSVDPTSATAPAPPFGGDALNYLGLSKYLRLDRSRTDGFLRAATALLDAGADPNTGFWTKGTHPERETALYGAAGVAHHPEMTRLLLERGADPNDKEVVYHSPETHDNRAMRLVVETGKVTDDNLVMMLIRKLDWHDYDGARYLLDRGADPNRDRQWGLLALHHSIARDNDITLIELLLERGADPTRTVKGHSALELAAQRGRGDVLAAFERRGVDVTLSGVDALIAACARGQESARDLARREPALLAPLLERGGTLLAQFAGTGNVRGINLLLDLGMNIAAEYAGDGYFSTPPESTALHVAAWRSIPNRRNPDSAGRPARPQGRQRSDPARTRSSRLRRIILDRTTATRLDPDAARSGGVDRGRSLPFGLRGS